jgi:hypothetical protein
LHSAIRISETHLWKSNHGCHLGRGLADNPKGKATVNEVCQEMASLPKLDKLNQAAASHATNFDPPYLQHLETADQDGRLWPFRQQ